MNNAIHMEMISPVFGSIINVGKVACDYCKRTVNEEEVRIIGDERACAGCQDRNLE